mgnify:FL=1|jgi:hypothetical protein
MDFDWANPSFALGGELTQQDVEESFEDAFVVRLLPDSARFAGQARYFNLGRSARGVGVFSLYRTNGKQVRVIYAREFLQEEQFFYKRRVTQLLEQRD